MLRQAVVELSFEPKGQIAPWAQANFLGWKKIHQRTSKNPNF